MLGFDAVVAAQRRKWIEEIYLENCRVASHFFWIETFLNIAKQIAKSGLAVVDVTPNPELTDLFSLSSPDLSWVFRLRDVGVPITVKGEAKASLQVVESVTKENRPAKTRMWAALRAYKKERVNNYAGTYQTGETRLPLGPLSYASVRKLRTDA